MPGETRNPEADAGALDKRVILLKPIYNAWEDEIPTWEAAAEVWAGINPQFAREQNESARTVTLTTVAITIRRRADIDARWRIREKYNPGMEYEVEGILDVLRRHAQMQLMCREVA